MRLTPTEFGKVRRILERIDEGTIQPRIPGRVGQFLRQYETARAQLDTVLAARGLTRRADDAISGVAVGPADVHPMAVPEVRFHEFPLGEVAESLSISEQLGVLTQVAMWLKARAANAVYNCFLAGQSAALSGDYRWDPISRLTPGEGVVGTNVPPVTWGSARCLKAVADDLGRPPHALEYLPEYRLGHPGLKFFRSICVTNDNGRWLVLPALSDARELEVETVDADAAKLLRASRLLKLLVFREPWSAAWTIVRASPTSQDEALAHAVTWLDFQSELQGEDLDATSVRSIRRSFSAHGIRAEIGGQVNLRRALLSPARDVLRHLRGLL